MTIVTHFTVAPLFRLSQRLFPLRRNSPIAFIFLFLSLSFFSCSPDDLEQDYDIITVDLPGHVHSMAFLNDSVGYVTGGDTWFSGFVGTTLDGGKTWNYDSLSPKMMMCLDIENNKGIVSGFEGLVFNLEQQNWIKQNINRNDFVRDIEVLNDSSSIMVGGLAYRHGTIVKFSNTGNVRSVWTEDEDNPELSAIAQLDDNILFVVGYGIILRSMDAGESWEIIDQHGDFFKDIFFVDTSTGYIVGYDGLLLKSTDGGLNWSKIRDGGNLDDGDRLKSITVSSSGDLWICGKSGLILISDDEGKNWSRRKLNTDSDLNKVSYHDGFIYVGGQDGFFARIEL